LRHGRDATDVLFSIEGSKAEAEPLGERFSMLGHQTFRTGVQSVADVVSVEQAGVDSALVEDSVYRVGDGALATPTESREPNDATSVSHQSLAVGPGDLMFMPDDLSAGVHGEFPSSAALADPGQARGLNESSWDDGWGDKRSREFFVRAANRS
jgi:hypothetical protein